MERFVGRRKELGVLESFMGDPSAHGCAVYGARQLGKTTILKQFASRRRSVYLQASMGSEETIVRRAMSYISQQFRTDGDPTTFSDLLDVLRDICSEEPTLIVIDEYPYISSSLEHADSMLQGFIDGPLTDTGSKIVICGSQLSSMLSVLTDRNNPLFNRFRISLRVEPMTFEDTCLFHQGMDDTDLMRMYMVFGGIPLDHIGFSAPTFPDAIRKMLSPGLPYQNIARGRISSEVGDVDTAVAILQAITSGHHTVKDISGYTGIPSSTCSKTLARLVGAGIVGQLTPMAGAPRRPVFRIEDGLIGLWYTVFEDLDEFMLPDDVSLRYEMVRGSVDTFIGHRFEMFCAEFVTRHYRCDAIGQWWGVEEDEDGKGVGVDIDLVADVREGGKRGTVFGECRFRSRPMKLSDLETLDRRARALDRNANLALFSASGFERQLEALAWRYGAVLIGPDVLMGRVPAPSLLSPAMPPIGGRTGDRARG